MRRKQKKNRKQEGNLQKLILLTAIANLITALINLIDKISD